MHLTKYYEMALIKIFRGMLREVEGHQTVDIRDGFLTREEVMARLGMKSVNTFKKCLKEGELPMPVSLAGEKFWSIQQINEFIYETNPHLQASNAVLSAAMSAAKE